MKIRIGFVSNSSSSSYLILREGKGLSDEEKVIMNRKILSEKYYDDEEFIDMTNKFNGKVAIGEISIPYGEDECDCVNEAISVVVSGFGIDEEISLYGLE